MRAWAAARVLKELFKEQLTLLKAYNEKLLEQIDLSVFE